jgi:rubrerythrin
VHFLMSPHHALRIALANEERAQRFFEEVAASPACCEEARALAKEFAAEEGAHAASIAGMLRKVAVAG